MPGIINFHTYYKLRVNVSNVEIEESEVFTTLKYDAFDYTDEVLVEDNNERNVKKTRLPIT